MISQQEPANRNESGCLNRLMINKIPNLALKTIATPLGLRPRFSRIFRVCSVT